MEIVPKFTLSTNICSTNRPYLQYIKSISSSWPHLRYLADWMEVTTAPPKWRFLSNGDRADREMRTTVAMIDFQARQAATRTNFKSIYDLSRALHDSGLNHDDVYARV